MGSPSGAPIPPGFYFALQANWGCDKPTTTTPPTPRTCVATEIPLFAWSTPWTILGGRLAFATAPTTAVQAAIHDVHHASGLFDPFVGAELAWDLGGGWGFAYLLGAYINDNTQVAYSSISGSG